MGYGLPVALVPRNKDRGGPFARRYIVARACHASAINDFAREVGYEGRMRKVAWLIAFAVSALLFGAADSAFAHSAAGHASPSVASSPAATGAEEIRTKRLPGEFVTASSTQQKLCPHGANRADCESCCACSSGVSAAIVTDELAVGNFPLAKPRLLAAAPLRLRQTSFDLSRPPKIFA